MATEKATKKDKEAEVESTPTVEATVTLPDSTPTEDSPAPLKEDLEKVDISQSAPLAGGTDTAPKLVTNDNGTVSYQGLEVQMLTHPEIVQGAVGMDNADPTKSVRVENIETPAVVRGFRITDERLHKHQIQAIMDDMEKNRPAVFADRKADLEKQRDAAPE